MTSIKRKSTLGGKPTIWKLVWSFLWTHSSFYVLIIEVSHSLPGPSCQQHHDFLSARWCWMIFTSSVSKEWDFRGLVSRGYENDHDCSMYYWLSGRGIGVNLLFVASGSLYLISVFSKTFFAGVLYAHWRILSFIITFGRIIEFDKYLCDASIFTVFHWKENEMKMKTGCSL